MKKNVKNPTKLKGWGIDTDTKNDPTYPIKNRTDEEQGGYNWDRPSQQAESVEVLHSNERPNLTAVFGTSVPPSGLSGVIRRIAFKYGEGSFGHWLPLLLADRINVVEGVLSDISKGYFPNFFAEKGVRAQWKYNREAVIQKLIAGLIILISTGVAVKVYRDKKIAKQKKLQAKMKKGMFLSLIKFFLHRK